MAKKVTTYKVQLGNTEERSGHRRDCAQLSAVVSIDYQEDEEHSPELAAQFVKTAIGEEGTLEIEVMEGVTIGLTLNASRVTKRDVVTK